MIPLVKGPVILVRLLIEYFVELSAGDHFQSFIWWRELFNGSAKPLSRRVVSSGFVRPCMRGPGVRFVLRHLGLFMCGRVCVCAAVSRATRELLVWPMTCGDA